MAESKDKPATISEEEFITLHKAQLEASHVPNSLWQKIYVKIRDQILDAGASFQLNWEEEKGFTLKVNAQNGLQKEQDVWLVDHAWTFKKESALEQLQQVPGLFDRVSAMLGFSDDDDEAHHHDSEDEDHDHHHEHNNKPKEHDFTTPEMKSKLEVVHKKLFEGLAHSYNVIKPDGDGGVQTLWYVMDEVGTAIRSSDKANAHISPLVCLHLNGIAFSILYLTDNVPNGGDISNAATHHH